MPYSPTPFRPAVALVAGAVAVAIPQLVRPHAGGAGAMLVCLFPVIAAAWFAGWREALVGVFAGAVALQGAPPPPAGGPDPWESAALWGSVFAALGGVGCLTLRRQVHADFESARRAIRDRFQSLVESNLVPMFLGTADGGVAAANAAWHRVTGTGNRSGRTGRWDGRTEAEARDATRDVVSGETARLDVTFRRSAGDDVSGHVYVVRLSGREVMGLFLDQSQARKTESDLRKEADGLIEADGRKDEALAILAHELRNPLAPIRTAAELIRRVTTAADRDRWSRVIETQVRVLMRLVDDLLDVSRIRRGKVEIKKVTLDLAAQVAAAAESIRPLMDARRHDFFVGVPTDGPVYVEADPQRMAQVLNNLLTNAAKYTAPGGRIDLSLDRTPGGAVITVRDTGLGIAPDFLPAIWDMFVQRRTGLDREGGGIGIGLALVKKLVELHGGTAEARSAGEGRGSQFTVTLPRTVLSWKNLPRPAAAPPPSRSPRKILVVEDNLAAAETIAAQLRIEGHAVTIVHDGFAAIATAAALRPDAILLDIGLPGMDGYEIARRLRRENGCQAIIIAVTGCATEENHTSGRDAGIDHYLLKPVPFDSLRDLIGAPRPQAGCGAGYEKIATVSSDTRELVPLTDRPLTAP